MEALNRAIEDAARYKEFLGKIAERTPGPIVSPTTKTMSEEIRKWNAEVERRKQERKHAPNQR